MIKVPGTSAGLPAIEELTRRGVNVNVTLLFSIERYEQVIDAYLRGLSARAEAGEPLDAITSVASFFLSRIDAKVDAAATRGLAAARPGRARQRARCLPALPGQVLRSGVGAPRGSGRATPAPAVGEHRDEEPRVLRRALRLRADRTGCGQHDARADASRVRRPRRDQPTLDADPAGARRTLADAAAAGIDLGSVTAELEREGVKSFCDSYHELLDCIESKLGVLATS